MLQVSDSESDEGLIMYSLLQHMLNKDDSAKLMKNATLINRFF